MITEWSCRLGERQGLRGTLSPLKDCLGVVYADTEVCAVSKSCA